MKTEEELKQLKIKYENLNKDFDELSKEELREVTGGVIIVPKSFGSLKDQFIDSAGTELFYCDTCDREYVVRGRNKDFPFKCPKCGQQLSP